MNSEDSEQFIIVTGYRKTKTEKNSKDFQQLNNAKDYQKSKKSDKFKALPAMYNCQGFSGN